MDRTSPQSKAATGIIVGRLVLFFIAAAAFVVALLLSRSHDRDANGSTDRYVCPMHPQVVSGVPGDCPICNMALERVQAAKQMQSIASSRGPVEAVKRRLITQVVRAPAALGRDGIVSAIVYKESLEGLQSGDRARFFRNSEPAKAILVRLTSQSLEPWDGSTVRATFRAQEFSDSESEVGWLQIDARPRTYLVVPESAILYSGDGPYVMAAATGERAFSRRSIQIGRNLDSGYAAEQAVDRLGQTVVLSGLGEGDRVVSADTFFVDAERRMRAVQDTAEEAIE